MFALGKMPNSLARMLILKQISKQTIILGVFCIRFSHVLEYIYQSTSPTATRSIISLRHLEIFLNVDAELANFPFYEFKSVSLTSSKEVV